MSKSNSDVINPWIQRQLERASVGEIRLVCSDDGHIIRRWLMGDWSLEKIVADLDTLLEQARPGLTFRLESGDVDQCLQIQWLGPKDSAVHCTCGIYRDRCVPDPRTAWRHETRCPHASPESTKPTRAEMVSAIGYAAAIAAARGESKIADTLIFLLDTALAASGATENERRYAREALAGWHAGERAEKRA